ncbi:MAG TPA: cobalamin-dependent protein [Candidatus Dormibacteraeota bacterium]|nr:cobalamin-dependent protein [Candidatus Dormibacteraeota bacterium]
MIGEAALVRGAIAPRTSWRGRRPPVRQLAEAMLQRDIGEAGDLVDQFLVRVGSRVAVFADLLQPAQYEVGNLWYQGQIGIGDEHRAACVLERLVAMLPATPSRGPVPAGARCLLTAVPGEQHTLGLTMFALALEDDGWEVELLDHAWEPDDLACLVERARPRLVGLSAGYLPSHLGVAHSVGAIRELGVPVLVGGSAFNRMGDLWRRVGASAHGPDPRIGTVLARRLSRQ